MKPRGAEYYRGCIISILNKKKALNICFIVCLLHETRSGKIKAYKTQQILIKTQVFFIKTELQLVYNS